MSSSIRSMARQMRREAAKDALNLKRIRCPKCRKPLQHRSLLGKKVLCPGCGWEGRIR